MNYVLYLFGSLLFTCILGLNRRCKFLIGANECEGDPEGGGFSHKIFFYKTNIEFEPVGPTLLKSPFDTRQDLLLLPILQLVDSLCVVNLSCVSVCVLCGGRNGFLFIVYYCLYWARLTNPNFLWYSIYD